MTTEESCEEIGRRLDLHHEPSVTGVVDVCAICGFGTADGYATGPRHLPQPHEADRACNYLATFPGTTSRPEVGMTQAGPIRAAMRRYLRRPPDGRADRRTSNAAQYPTQDSDLAPYRMPYEDPFS